MLSYASWSNGLDKLMKSVICSPGRSTQRPNGIAGNGVTIFGQPANGYRTRLKILERAAASTAVSSDIGRAAPPHQDGPARVLTASRQASAARLYSIASASCWLAMRSEQPAKTSITTRSPPGPTVRTTPRPGTRVSVCSPVGGGIGIVCHAWVVTARVKRHRAPRDAEVCRVRRKAQNFPRSC